MRAARHELAGAERATPGEFAAGRASSELVATGLLATAGQHAAPGIGLSDASVALDEEEPVGIDWSYNDTHWLGMDEHTGLAGIDLSALPLVDWDSLEIQEEKEEEGIKSLNWVLRQLVQTGIEGFVSLMVALGQLLVTNKQTTSLSWLQC